MTPEEIISYLREPMARVGDNAAAALIESLQSERDALAETARGMREALRHTLHAMRFVPDTTENDHINEGIRLAHERGSAALALTPTAAEERAEANAEKAALLDCMELCVVAMRRDTPDGITPPLVYLELTDGHVVEGRSIFDAGQGMHEYHNEQYEADAAREASDGN